MTSETTRRQRPSRRCTATRNDGQQCEQQTKYRKPGTATPMCHHHGGK